MKGSVGVSGLVLLAASAALWLRSSGASERRPDPPAGTSIRLYSEEAKGYVALPAVVKTAAEWKRQLTPLQFQVTREAGTERAFTGEYWNNHRAGLYRCVACGTD